MPRPSLFRAIAVALIVFAGSAVLAQSPAGPTSVGPRIPNVVGQMAHVVATALAPTKLPVVSLDTVVAGAANGIVVAQRPAAGTPVARISEITILVARPPRRLPSSVFTSVVGSAQLPPRNADAPVAHPPIQRDIVVPDLFGRSPRAVAAALEASRLRPGAVTYDSSDRTPAGYAFDQEPHANTRVELGSRVDVIYSLGPHQRVATTTVPRIETRTIAQAGIVLRRANLRLGRLDTLYEQGGDGRIAHQEPHAGTRLHAGDAVDATVTMRPAPMTAPPVIGPAPTQVVVRPNDTLPSLSADSVARVPAVVNMIVVVAQDAVRDAGFAGTRVISNGPIGRAVVVGQSPTAGEPENRLSVITIMAETTIVRPVPDLVGWSEDGAHRAARRDQLLVTARNRLHRFTWSRTVISQQPAAGAAAPGDRTIGVDLAIPVVPPIPAAIALGLLGVTGLTRETIRWLRLRVRHFTVNMNTPVPDRSALSSNGGDAVIRSTVEFRYSLGMPTGDVAGTGTTIIKTEKVRHA